MSVLVCGSNISDAWLKAFEQLNSAPSRRLVNLAVSIENPLEEDAGIRLALEQSVANLRHSSREGSWQSVHTVANTIFPISYYNPSIDNAAERFFRFASTVSRKHERGHEWGTYIGRLVSYQASDGTSVNQLERFLKILNEPRKWSDVYEAPLTYPDERHPVNRADSDMQIIGPLDRRLRGGPCLAHISITQLDGRLNLTALYRRHHYVARAYGNFLGLARLLSFLATESGSEVGEILVVGTHAEIEDDLQRAPRIELIAEGNSRRGDIRPIETADRPLGASWQDVELPPAKAKQAGS